MTEQAEEVSLFSLTADLFSQNIGLILSIIITIIITFIVAHAYHRKNVYNRQIAYQIRDEFLLGYKSKLLPEDIEIKYKDREIRNLKKAVLILWNGGSSTISEDDLIERDPLRLHIDNAHILDAYVIKKSRDVVSGRTVSTKDPETQLLSDVSITFNFLDRNDGFILVVFYESMDGKKAQSTDSKGQKFTESDETDRTIESVKSSAPKSNIEVLGTVKGIPHGFKKQPWNPQLKIVDELIGPAFGSLFLPVAGIVMVENGIQSVNLGNWGLAILGFGLGILLTGVGIVTCAIVYKALRNRPPKTLRDLKL